MSEPSAVQRLVDVIARMRLVGARTWQDTEGNAPGAFGRLEARIAGFASELEALVYELNKEAE